MPLARFNGISESNDAGSVTQMTGAPHVSYSLYFAALVLFCARPGTSRSSAEIILDFRTAALALSSTKEQASTRYNSLCLSPVNTAFISNQRLTASELNGFTCLQYEQHPGPPSSRSYTPPRMIRPPLHHHITPIQMLPLPRNQHKLHLAFEHHPKVQRDGPVHRRRIIRWEVADAAHGAFWDRNGWGVGKVVLVEGDVGVLGQLGEAGVGVHEGELYGAVVDVFYGRGGGYGA
ncbi:hypothetical protein LTR02_014304 [Friedmanniomyces endolithicus]|nr:hypothetical protein LTR94_018247 [Friedmanniomyces endolithicus]KAK0775542.1 hypothetical protein LTR59_014487 [Friedmanniomyces endolithicus]KAK0806041.1 hypothetical protein LTR38_005258 [Friedmanniomyces endolithicus]KAK0837704.1 hypothetical protein LTR03_012574 [Friedmanniomyces endolithicus]KAK0867471.1 hypothetical protein LTS02_004209 [Friedmanniomyces endolithicus]